MGPGASKLKHLPVKQQDKTRTTKGHGCAERDAVLGVQMAHLRRNEKTQTGKTVQGRAVCLVLDFMLKPLPNRR